MISTYVKLSNVKLSLPCDLPLCVHLMVERVSWMFYSQTWNWAFLVSYHYIGWLREFRGFLSHLCIRWLTMADQILLKIVNEVIKMSDFQFCWQFSFSSQKFEWYGPLNTPPAFLHIAKQIECYPHNHCDFGPTIWAELIG